MISLRRLSVIVPALTLVSCNDQGSGAKVPAPQDITADAVTEFCSMGLAEHDGPKGQIFLRGRDKPVWFASVRDTVAFTMLPEMPKSITVIYVTDMARAHNWAQPEPGTWIEAHKAVYVIDSHRRGGMNAAEAVPFGDAAAARRFVADNGGRIVSFAGIPQSYILASGNGP